MLLSQKRIKPLQLGALTALLVLFLSFVPAATQAAIAVTLTADPSGEVEEGRRDIRFTTTVTGITSDFCPKNEKDLHWRGPRVLMRFSSGADLPTEVGSSIIDGSAHEINSNGRASQTFITTASFNFEKMTVRHFEAYVYCDVSVAARSNVLTIRTKGATGYNLIDVSNLSASWSAKAKTYVVPLNAREVTISMIQAAIRIKDKKPNEFLERNDIITDHDNQQNRAVVERFEVGIDYFGRKPKEWKCDQLFLNICEMPIKHTISNPSGERSFRIPLSSDGAKGTIRVPVERKAGESFGVALYPLIFARGPAVDLPFVTPGQQIIIRFDNVSEQREEGGPLTGGESGPPADVDVKDGIAATIADKAGGVLFGVVNIVVGAILSILRWIIWILGSLIFVPLLNATMTITAGEIASGPILVGWTIVRDIANMVFILVLIAIGLGTILRVESYSYKKLLVNVLGMAMLVNFSLLIGRIILQVADAVQFSFLPDKAAGGGADAETVINTIFHALSTLHPGSIFDGFRTLTLDVSGSQHLAGTFALFFQFLLEFGVILTFGALSIFMLIRTVAIWILLIISPVAYALAILPATAHLAKQWWSNFLKYAMFAPIIAFFIRLTYELYQRGLELLPSFTQSTGGVAAGEGAVAGASTGDLLTQLRAFAAQQGSVSFSQALELGLVYIVILAFLWASLIVARQMGIAGAGAIVGFATAGLGLGAVAGGLIAGFGARKLGKRLGVQLMPKQWIEGFKEYRQKRIQEDIKETEAKARKKSFQGKMLTSFGSPEDFFNKTLRFSELKRFTKNVSSGRININKHWLNESKAIEAERAEADQLVTQDEYDQAQSEKANKESEKANKESEKAKLEGFYNLADSGLSSGNLDLSNDDLKGAVKELLNRMWAESKLLIERGEEAEGKALQDEIGRIREQIKTNPRSVVFDKTNDIGGEIAKMLESVKTGLRDKDGNGKIKDAQEKINDVQKEIDGIKKFLTEKSGKTVDPQERMQRYDKLRKRGAELDKVRSPLSYEATLSRNALVADEKKKLSGIDNSDELIGYLNDAIRSHNRYRALAVMEKLSEDYNDNEFLNKTVRKDGKGTYESNSKGMHEFRKEIMQEKLGMSEVEALEFTSKLGYINESRSHWETARLVGFRNGRPYAYSESEHATAAAAEIAKQGTRSILQRLNRLGYGGEVEKADGSRYFKPSLLGLTIMKGLGQALADSQQFNHINPNAAGKLSSPEAVNMFVKVGVPQAAITALRGMSGGKDWQPGAVANDVAQELNRLHVPGYEPYQSHYI